MNKLKLALWILALANAVLALAGCYLAFLFENIFGRTVEGGQDALSLISKIYINHEEWIFAVFTIPLSLAALIHTVRRPITPEGALHFGAVTLLLISLQILLAIVALGSPYIIPITRFHG